MDTAVAAGVLLVLLLVMALVLRTFFVRSYAAVGGGAQNKCPPPAVTRARRAAAALIQRNGFGPPAPEDLEELQRASGLSARQAESLYVQEVMGAAMRAPAAAAGDERRTPTAEARRQRVPPMRVVKQRRAVAAADLAEAAEADLGSSVWGNRFLERSRRFEAEVEAELARRGADFETEADLIRRGAPLTPDFLLRTPLRIGGREVNWIDAKDFFHYGSPILTKSLARTWGRYTAAHGPGAFVFSSPPACVDTPWTSFELSRLPS